MRLHNNRIRRVEALLTQGELAERAKVSKDEVGQWDLGLFLPWEVYQRIEAALRELRTGVKA